MKIAPRVKDIIRIAAPVLLLMFGLAGGRDGDTARHSAAGTR